MLSFIARQHLQLYSGCATQLQWRHAPLSLWSFVQSIRAVLTHLTRGGARQDLCADVSLLECLGHGAHAKVYKGTCPRSGRPCAVKVAQPQSSALLEAEVAILRKLDHPHIAKLLGSGKGPCGRYFMLEFCSGGDIFDCLDREGRFPERAAARVFGQLCEAVAYMHSRGVCHRDLKEENILIAKPGPLEELTVKVCDFGISRSKGMSSAPADALCTFSYAAPEVLAGGAGDEPADLWSCGVILCSLLCGRLPFDGKSPAEVLARVRAGGPSFHEGVWRRVSEGAVGLIRRLLRREIATRYTAEQALAHPWISRQAPQGAKAKAPTCLMAAWPSSGRMVLLHKALLALEGAILPCELSVAFRAVGIAEDEAASSQLRAAAAAGNGLVDCSAILRATGERRSFKTLLGMESASCIHLRAKEIGSPIGSLRRSVVAGDKV